MSAQILRYEPRAVRQHVTPALRQAEVGDDTPTLPRLPWEAVYQALFAPEATPEEIAREYFLLECD